jgi:hypothetical protein
MPARETRQKLLGHDSFGAVGFGLTIADACGFWLDIVSGMAINSHA